jgi:membrane protease YdiL (CAAX protease family)
LLGQLAGASLISVVLILAAKRYRDSRPWGSVVLAILVAWAVALPILIPVAVRFDSVNATSTAIAFLSGLAVFGAACVSLGIAWRRGHLPSRALQLYEEALKTPVRAFILMVVVAPLCEEYIFRGFLYDIFAAWGALVAIAFTTALFVAMHRDWWSVPHLIVAGLVFALLRQTSDGLALPIIAHALANLVAFAALFFVVPRTRWAQVVEGQASGSAASVSLLEVDDGRSVL